MISNTQRKKLLESIDEVQEIAKMIRLTDASVSNDCAWFVASTIYNKMRI